MQKAQLEVYTKQQFNYKRNNSNLMSTCLTWNLQQDQDDQIEELSQGQGRTVQFEKQSSEQKYVEPGKNPNKAKIQSPNTLIQKKVNTKVERPHNEKSQRKKDYSRFEKTLAQIQEQNCKREERKQKIKDYIESLVPYSRNLTDSKFQQYYRKSAPLAYGNSNTTQPIGGIIYGNNLRTFNVNPHDYQNNPKYYQSHATSLNFAHRTKRDESKHWKRLEKQLNKKLNLREANSTLEEGKQTVYVNVNDLNMYQIMKQNLQFKKEHRNQIRKEEKNYWHQKEMKFKAENEKIYRSKAQIIQQDLQKTAETVFVNRQPGQRLRDQVIYKHQDKEGNLRIGADRHALTCFVDTNFAENNSIYTEELKSRFPIFPTQVEDRHKNLAIHKCENAEKSLSNPYPSYYLLPCNEQPEIQKMLIQKSRQQQLVKKKY